jgi:hypothetical protein
MKVIGSSDIALAIAKYFRFQVDVPVFSTDYFINATSLITLVVLGKMVHEKRDDS